MKKSIVFALVLVLLIPIFGGCAKDEPADPGQEAGETTVSTTGQAVEEPAEPKGGNTGVALSQALAAFNESLRLLLNRSASLYSEGPDGQIVWDHYLRRVQDDYDTYTFAAPLALGEMNVEEWRKYWYEDKAEMGVEGNVTWASRFGLDRDKMTAEMIDGGKGVIFTYSKEGKLIMGHYEFRPTSSGYRVQYSFEGLPAGHVNHYLIANEEDRWVFGFMETPEIPDLLSDDEPLDFPKSAPVWISVDGDQVLARTEDGEDIKLTLPPPE